ncbi:MAG: DNA-processing protein DprA [Clostridiales bacterium]|nr:DNA-processing protein DprA [Candidatus Blautia equi]
MEETQYKIREIGKESPLYPEKLRNYAGMPSLLYVKGKLPDPELPTVAIVGARNCSPYGRTQAFRFARTLSEAGVQVISGLAYGIDGEAHKGALEGSTPTFAILGTGVDICYPSSNQYIYNRILRQNGGLISEFEPGERAKNYHFPLRNRVISALSDIVLVVEAKNKSGSLITARYALEQGKNVYALPGSVTEELSLGCNKLIFDGAGIAYSPDVLLSEFGISAKKYEKYKQKEDIIENLTLESDLKLLYSCLDLRPKTPDILVKESGLAPDKINQALMELQLLGLAKEAARHHYIRNSD